MSVKITVPDFVLKTQDFSVTIEPRYTFGRSVSGTLRMVIATNDRFTKVMTSSNGKNFTIDKVRGGAAVKHLAVHWKKVIPIKRIAICTRMLHLHVRLFTWDSWDNSCMMQSCHFSGLFYRFHDCFSSVRRESQKVHLHMWNFWIYWTWINVRLIFTTLGSSSISPLQSPKVNSWQCLTIFLVRIHIACSYCSHICTAYTCNWICGDAFVLTVWNWKSNIWCEHEGVAGHIEFKCRISRSKGEDFRRNYGSFYQWVWILLCSAMAMATFEAIWKLFLFSRQKKQRIRMAKDCSQGTHHKIPGNHIKSLSKQNDQHCHG